MQDHPVAKLVDAKGGPESFGAPIRKRPGAVRTWIYRRQIPRSAWPEIIEAYPDVTMDTLKALEAPPG